MKNQASPLPVTRREFLLRSAGGLGLVAFSGFAPAFLAQTARAGVAAPEKDRRILVLLQLAGGNDGLNTCIPYQDDTYFNLRPNLAIRDGIPINDLLALHPACGPMERLWKDGSLSILQNVGYPNPNRSHFRSTEIWETATDSDVMGHTGWMGRYFDNACDGAGHASDDPLAIHVGNETPGHFWSEDTHSVFGLRGRGQGARRGKGEAELLESLATAPAANDTGHYLQHVMMDTLVTERRVAELIGKHKAQAKYPGGGLSQSLKNIAALIAAGLETRVYFLSQSGYDTHANQAGTQAGKLRELAGALHAFQQDLARHHLDDQVLTLVFSEFGRRPSQNASQGTDHGTAGPVFVLGQGLGQPLFGGPPDLNNLENDDLRHAIDFRQVYAAILRDWFEANPATVLHGDFAPLPLLDRNALAS